MARKKSLPERFKDDQIKGAQKDLIDQLFNDHYKNRFEIYKINFFRGIAFGFGSILGATVLILVLMRFLSFFDEMPFIGDIVQSVQHSIERRHN